MEEEKPIELDEIHRLGALDRDKWIKQKAGALKPVAGQPTLVDEVIALVQDYVKQHFDQCIKDKRRYEKYYEDRSVLLYSLITLIETAQADKSIANMLVYLMEQSGNYNQSRFEIRDWWWRSDLYAGVRRIVQRCQQGTLTDLTRWNAPEDRVLNTNSILNHNAVLKADCAMWKKRARHLEKENSKEIRKNQQLHGANNVLIRKNKKLMREKEKLTDKVRCLKADVQQLKTDNVELGDALQAFKCSVDDEFKKMSLEFDRKLEIVRRERVFGTDLDNAFDDSLTMRSYS